MSCQDNEYYISTFMHAKQKHPNGYYEVSFQCTTALKFRYLNYYIFKYLATTTYRGDTSKLLPILSPFTRNRWDVNSMLWNYYYGSSQCYHWMQRIILRFYRRGLGWC